MFQDDPTMGPQAARAMRFNAPEHRPRPAQGRERRHAALGARATCALVAMIMTAGFLAAPTEAAPPRGKTAPAASGTSASTPATPAVPATQGLAPRDAPQIAARSWLLMDVTTGQLLAASDPDMRVEPASLTKLMTAYLAFTAVKEKKLATDARPPVSPLAHKAIGSRMFVDPASPATVEELLHGLIIQSGNDAAIILAEAIGGTEEAFAQQMNREAKRMGLTNTQFGNASGLPGAQHYSTARDLATLAIRVIEDHPDFYKLYAQRDYTFNNIKQPNRNRLLFVDPTVDGMKTGHTEAAGFCLVASSVRTAPGTDVQRRLLSVVLGTASESARTIESQKLLNYGFASFDTVRLYARDAAAATYPVFKGSAEQIKAGFSGPVMVSVPRGRAQAVKGEIERIQPLIAPVEKGQRIGTLRVQFEDKTIAEHPLIALEAVGSAGWFGRAWDSVRLWFR
jgi:D-alanyl-D-alanine carboxypeptidase (penicillin-binding protein 5/6)